MARKSLASYAREHRHFYTASLQPLLLETVAHHGGDVIADLGAGDGAVLWALQRRGLLGEIVYAIDLSPERVKRAQQLAPNIRGVVADATRVDLLSDQAVDGIIVSQVIEHLEDDRALAPEIARLLRPGGWWYVGTILRGRRAWWIYRVDGRWQLDPTHVREYRSKEELLIALEHEALRVAEVRVTPLSFPVSDLALRGLASAGLLSRDSLSRIYSRSALLSAARGLLRLRVPGYWLLECSGSKVGNATPILNQST
jgi:2-polyprenyl-3-methyl-5-hydroxy-6-metoxy-1,4-benzoquinol methylase